MSTQEPLHLFQNRPCWRILIKNASISLETPTDQQRQYTRELGGHAESRVPRPTKSRPPWSHLCLLTSEKRLLQANVGLSVETPRCQPCENYSGDFQRPAKPCTTSSRWLVLLLVSCVPEILECRKSLANRYCSCLPSLIPNTASLKCIYFCC
jgi:hypothetical protein